jgi:hypothetical protein
MFRIGLPENSTRQVFNFPGEFSMPKGMKDYFIDAATAAHQVEGKNVHSDLWVMKHLEHSSFQEPSLEVVD